MKYVKPDIATICIGQCASFAAVLLAAGTKGKRYALPNATIHFHPAGGGGEGYAPDLERMVKELLRIQRVGNELLAHATGRTVEDLERDFSRDRFMTAQEAKEYGLIDEILDSSTPAPAGK
jgi:ATP-dependent Clp protease protease subunit